MANTVQNIFNNLVARVTNAQGPLIGPCTALQVAYTDISTSPTSAKSIVIPLPRLGPATVQPNGVPVTRSFNIDEVTMTFGEPVGVSGVFFDVDQAYTDQQISSLFTGPAVGRVMEGINAVVLNQLTPANFAVNPVITTGGGQVQPTDITNARKALSKQLVPVTDQANMNLLLGADVYNNMLPNTVYTAEQITGINAAEAGRAGGYLRRLYGANVLEEPALPTTGSGNTASYTSYYGHRWAIALAVRVPSLGPNDGQTCFSAITFARPGVPVRVSLQYQLSAGGWVFSVQAMAASTVVRPEMGQILLTTAA